MSNFNQYTMQDPRSQYPKAQEKSDDRQPEPGLDAILKPQADHGEESYCGANSLAGRKALITEGDSGIGRVNAVAPGPVWTPLQQSGGQPDEKLQHFGDKAPIGRAGQPAEVAPAFVFLASQESSCITAEVIGVTGGAHLP